MSFFKTYDKNRSFLTIEWTLSELFKARILGVIIAMIVFGIFTTIIPTIWLFFYFTSIKNQRKEHNLIGMLAGVYFLLDYHFGWMCWIILNDLIGAKYYNILCYYNTALMITHFVLLLFDSVIWDLLKVNDNKSRARVFFIFVFFLVVVSYIFSELTVKNFITKHKETMIINSDNTGVTCFTCN